MSSPSTSSAASTPLPDPTVEQGERFLALLCRFGFDSAFDRALGGAASPTPIQPGRPSTGYGQQQAEADNAPPPASASAGLDIGGIIRELALKGATAELASIVYNIPVEEARKRPFGTLGRDVVPFVMASMTLMAALVGFGMGSGLSTAPALSSTPTGSPTETQP